MQIVDDLLYTASTRTKERQVGITYTSSRNGKTETSVEYVGRVIKTRSYTARRNMSDTLDYSDYQDVTVHEALVWLGESYTDRWTGKEVRPTVAEQFRWIDVSNHFSWRDHVRTAATPDATVPVDPSWGTMWTNYYEWETIQLANEEARKAEQVRLDELRKQAEAAANATRAAKFAKDNEAKAACEAILKNKKFAKGATVVLRSGVSGKIIWAAAKKFRNKWNARIGVKDSRGDVHWVNTSDVK